MIQGIDGGFAQAMTYTAVELDHGLKLFQVRGVDEGGNVGDIRSYIWFVGTRWPSLISLSVGLSLYISVNISVSLLFLFVFAVTVYLSLSLYFIHEGCVLFFPHG